MLVMPIIDPEELIDLSKPFNTPADVILDIEDTRDRQTIPERALLADILAMAIMDATNARYDSKLHRHAAYRWIVNCSLTDTEPAIFTYPWVCQSLNLDALAIRNEVILLCKHKIKFIAPRERGKR